MSDVLTRIAEALPPDIVVSDPDLIRSYVRDESRFTDAGIPVVVLLPRTTAQVALALTSASDLGLDVVTRGAGSGLSGGANAVDGCVVLSTRRIDAILELDSSERLVVAQPGVVTAVLRAEAARHGLLYPPDPGSVAISTIGGNVATNAGGMCCVKYGVTGDYVLGLEVVLADGRVVRTGRRTVKGVAGYDLTRLFVGSEGTLGVITEVTLRLVPAAAEAHTVLATFDDVATAGRRGRGRRATPVSFPRSSRSSTGTTLRAIEAVSPLGFDAAVGAVVLMQSDAPSAEGRRQQSSPESASPRVPCDVAVSDDPDEAHALLEARRSALPALERLGDWLLDDVCVPRSRIVDLIRARRARCLGGEPDDRGLRSRRRRQHASDRHLRHPDPESRESAQRAFDRITAAALDLGGTVTGEHGIGRLKTGWLTRELDPVAAELHGVLKRAIDPAGILNPGVGLPATCASLVTETQPVAT